MIILVTTTGLFFIFTTSPSYHQTLAQETSETKETIEQANKEGDQTIVNDTHTYIEQEKEELKPVSDEMLEYAEEQFPSLKDPNLSREEKVEILNQQFTDPELGLQSMRNLELSLQTMQYKIDQVIEKLYIECTVAKEKGEFDKTIDCMNWARDNAAIPIN